MHCDQSTFSWHYTSFKCIRKHWSNPLPHSSLIYFDPPRLLVWSSAGLSDVPVCVVSIVSVPRTTAGTAGYQYGKVCRFFAGRLYYTGVMVGRSDNGRGQVMGGELQSFAL